MDFDNNTAITWEGRSCNGRTVEGSTVGVMFYGEKGSLLIDGGNAYYIYDLQNNKVKEVKNEGAIDARNLASPTQQLDALHIQNFFDGISKGSKLNSDILNGHQSTLLVQLGNIAQRSGHTLNINPNNGHIIKDKAAMKFWKRDYQPGWEPKV
jgi:hypothetical protein